MRWCAWRRTSTWAAPSSTDTATSARWTATPPPPCAYTEARLEPLALELLRDIEKNTVPFSLNFDDSLKEPDMLPGRFPNLLVNGASGIAVGLATNIPPHNLAECIDGIVAYIDKPTSGSTRCSNISPRPISPRAGISSPTNSIRAIRRGRAALPCAPRCAWRTATTARKTSSSPSFPTR